MRAPLDAQLTQVPRPSMKDRHSASFGLKPSKAIPDSRPSAVPAVPVDDKSESNADELQLIM